MKISYTILVCLIIISYCFDNYASQQKIDYWKIQRKGANYFNKSPSPDWFSAAKYLGIEFVRLAPDKWKCQQRDFLIGDADKFKKIPLKDLEVLKSVLDEAYKNDIKVVITVLSLPGSRWKQTNNGNDDLRLWQDEKYRMQAIQFWTNLALELKDHPAIFGYNILNEPHPELLSGIHDFRKINFDKWNKTIEGSLADLNLFYKDIVKAIREMDSNTPIIVDTGLYATPWAIEYLKPLDDAKILYSFHMYEPFAYTTRKINQDRFTYPGNLPNLLEDAEKDAPSTGSTTHWNKFQLNEFLKPVMQWQRKYEIPSSLILVGEFGCDRTAKGAEKYLADLIDIFNANGWHWAFYAFREDCWDSMDYEIGQRKACWQYWEALENGKSLNEFRKDNPLFDIIKGHFLNLKK